MTTPQLLTPDWVAYSSPTHNNPLVSRVERLGRNVRALATQIEALVSLPFRELYEPSRPGLGFTLSPDDVARRATWALIGEWLVAASVGPESVTADLRSAHQWFWDGSGRELGSIPSITVAVDVSTRTELRALMPYLLDPMAAATRRDVLNAQSTAEDRRARKAAGVYYTPGDVAQLMVKRVDSAREGSKNHLWLDPAHGSGVFLRAMLSNISHQPRARERIYGIDLDPFAAESASFVLTAEDLASNPQGPAPWQRWHQFRRNLATGDALLIDTTTASSQAAFDFDPCPQQATQGSPLGTSGRWRLDSVFPETAEDSFARIIANPPYSPLQPSPANFHIPHIHPITGPFAKQDISAIFVELCSNLLPHGGALAIVLPLSITASTRAPFPNLRKHLSEQPGHLEMLSFDRVPDALFGDDIKTRNAIVYLDKASPHAITTSPLYRWTSRTREAALSKVPVASVEGVAGVPSALPKIGSSWERDLLVACERYPHSLELWHTGRQVLPLDQLPKALSKDGSDVVAVAPTAYNFLSVLREPYRAVTEGHNSQNSLSVLHFSSELNASAAYAVLNSRLAFWMWHVMGDGFHVTNTLYKRIPAPINDEIRLMALADLGDKLWKASLGSPAVSTNRGRTTVAFPTWTNTELINEIDAEVEAYLGLKYQELVTTWHQQLVVVDFESDRRHLLGKKTH